MSMQLGSGVMMLIPNLLDVEIIAKGIAMKTGQNQVVLSRHGEFAIQPAHEPVPDDWETRSTMIAGIDLLGMAGPPTISGPLR